MSTIRAALSSAFLVPLLVATAAVALSMPPPVTAAIAAPPDVDAKVDTIVRPLAAVPAILTVDGRLEVELSEAAGEIHDVAARLVPSFGQARDPVDLIAATEVTHGAVSQLWPDRTVTAVEFDLPADARLGGLYDLHVEWSGPGSSGTDAQRRAISVVDEHPSSPRVAVIADPSVGDPRPVQEGAEDTAAGDPDSLINKTDRTLGVSDGNGRWGALKQVIDELNLVRPDAVLVAGDLTFGVHPRPLPYEYEDAWEILDRLEVPAFLSPGNHDLYEFDHPVDDADAIDGLAMWEQYFGPVYYSADVGPSLHLVALNTFDWEERAVAQPPDTSILSGGQIRSEQLQWLRNDLARYRADHPRGSIITLAHHDPSWIQGRHPWPGENRLELRDLLDTYDVGVHFAGHTHEDRVARYHRGNIVQTSGRPHRGDPVRKLSYVRREDDSLDASWPQRRLGRILRNPRHGPLFVTTTTAGSGLKGEDWGLGGYWGWRLADLTAGPRGGYDPAGFGYPVTRAFLDEHAERPENWNARHARYGVFSYPSYHLSVDTLDGNDGASSHAVVQVSSDLATDLDVTVRLVLSTKDGSALEVDGGRLVRTRTDGEAIDVWVTTVVPAHGTRTVAVSARSG